MRMPCGRRRGVGHTREHVVLLGALVLAAGAAGCADFVTPTGRYAVTHPWDTSTPVTRGTTKAEVREIWGPPDAVIALGVDELGLPKEEWIYHARTGIPVDIRYFSKSKYLIFTGESVTGWIDEAAQDGPTHH